MTKTTKRNTARRAGRPTGRSKEDTFVRQVVVRGEAAPASTRPLPPAVTHVILGTSANGTPTLKRRRFAAF